MINRMIRFRLLALVLFGIVGLFLAVERHSPETKAIRERHVNEREERTVALPDGGLAAPDGSANGKPSVALLPIFEDGARIPFSETLPFGTGTTPSRDPYFVKSLRPDRSVPPRQASDINNAMDRELEAADIPADFGERMEALFRNKSVDEMVRNFAVQHLERFAQERTVRGTWDIDSEEAAKIRAALENAALEVDNSIGGTAMLALARLSEIDPHVDRRRLSSRSASLVANPSTRLSTRIAAAQLCGLLRVHSALPALRSLSSDPSAPTPLRLAAEHATEEIEDR